MLTPLLLFVSSSVWLTWPLGAHATSHVPGGGPGDNVACLWNFWWMRHVLGSSSEHFFQTRFLFWPFGVSLVLHTHSALLAFIGATALRSASIVTAQNVLIIFSYALNGFAAYLLAWSATRHRAGSILAGLFFQSSPYFSAHLNGHFTLIAAWGLPLYALTFWTALERESWRAVVAAGVTLVAVLYTDYYYVIYSLVLTACLLGSRWLTIRVESTTASRSHTRLDTALKAFLVSLAAGLLVVWTTGGGAISFGRWGISMTSGLNIRSAMWIVLFVLLWRRWRPAFRVRRRPGTAGRDLWITAVIFVVFALGAAPLVWAALDLWRRGEYVSQIYFWRSAPAGVDLASFLLGNPFHPVWGALVQRAYAVWGTSAIESASWLGLAPMAVLLLTRRTWVRDSAAIRWLGVGLVFLIWALGPHLTIAGFKTGLLMPGILLRYVPVVANARIPGRAMVMVYLSASVVVATAIKSSRLDKRPALLWLLGFALVIDFDAAPFPLFALETPALYGTLASLPQGAVIEAPLGIRDGFGFVGSLDERTLFYQSVHGKPLVGGFVARMPRALETAYRRAPVLGPLLRLSSGERLALVSATETAATASDFLDAHQIRYIVLDTDRATVDLQDYVRGLPTTLIERSDGRELYVVRARSR